MKETRNRKDAKPPSRPDGEGLDLAGSILDGIGAEILAVDAAGRVTAWNRRIEERVCPGSEVIGKPFDVAAARMWDAAAARDVAEAMRTKALGSGEAVRFERLPCRCPDGRTLLYDAWINPLPGSAGGPGAVLMRIDLTDRYTSSDRSLRSAKASSLANLGASIAHEIRNPLNSISVHMQLLKEEIEGLGRKVGRDTLESVDMISEEIRRLNRIVDGFLKFSRMPAPDLKPGDLNHAARLAVKLLAAEAAGLGVSVEFKEGDIPQVLIDGDLIRQAIYNVVLNAVQACGGSGRVLMSTRKDRHSVAIEISDTGPGIPPAEREKVFDIFYSRKEGGTGLGLPIANRIVEEHGGRIAIGQGSAGGASFEIHLPLAGGS